MKWRGRKRSGNVVDRRGTSGGFSRSSRGGHGGIGIPTGRGGGLGIGAIIVILIIGAVLGVNPLTLFDGSLGTGTGTGSISRPLPNAGEDDLADFVAVVVQDTEDLWSDVFDRNDLTYEPATVVLFSDTDRSGCGLADARTGPFYCPADRTAYIDLSFYETLRRQFGAPGDFAQAYVIAHEIGHHVQNLVGVLPEYNRAIASMSQEEANANSVRIELQADCYAGVWANYVGEENLLEDGDVAEAINAAEQIGDDAIQRRTQGVVVPKTFTHGTSAQRQEWFERGYATGDVGQCDTFSGNI